MLLFSSPDFKTGDCYTIDKVIISVKIVDITEEEYIGHYWVPWLYKYVPKFNIPKSRIKDAKKVQCLKEKKIGE